MGNKVELTDDLKDFFRTYYNRTQRMMYAYAKRLVSDRELDPAHIPDIVHGAYTNLVIALAEENEISDYATSLVLNPRKVGFYFLDEYFKENMDSIAEELKQPPAYSVEQDFRDSTSDRTFGQNLIVNIFSQRCGIGDIADVDNRLSTTDNSRRVEEEYFSRFGPPVSLDTSLFEPNPSAEFSGPKFHVSSRGCKYKGISAPVLIE